MMTAEINSKKVEIKQGETIYSTLKRTGISLPSLCNWEGLSVVGHCRICVVEVEGLSELVPSCSFPIEEGMKIKTHSKKVQNARNLIFEMILANHPQNCLQCSSNGKCELQTLSKQLNITKRFYYSEPYKYFADYSNPSIIREPSKCVLCGRCIRVCDEIQSVYALDYIGKSHKTIVGTAFNSSLNESTCVNCGQCIISCPTAALQTKYSINEVFSAIDNPEKHVVAMVSPAVSVTIAENLGFKTGIDISGILNSALYAIGFNKVFDSSFAADLYVMENASLLANRIGNNNLPLILTCSSAAEKFINTNFPEFNKHLSSCKSINQMLGILIKTYYSKQNGIKPEDIYTVAITQCTPEKFDISKENNIRINDYDAVLTSNEIEKMVNIKGISLNSLYPEVPNYPFAERSSAGKLFGISGGKTEAILRTLFQILTGNELEQVEFQNLRGITGRKEGRIKIGELSLGYASTSGLRNVRTLLDEIKKGKDDLHIIEVSACPAGCINGGGQPKPYSSELLKARMKALYTIDRSETIRVSHKNKSLMNLYSEFLETPLSNFTLELLHNR